MGWYIKSSSDTHWTEEDVKKFINDCHDTVKECGFEHPKAWSITDDVLRIELVPSDPSCNCAKLSLFDNFMFGEEIDDEYVTTDDIGRSVTFVFKNTF